MHQTRFTIGSHKTVGMQHRIQILRLTELRRPAAEVRTAIDAIFYETAPLAPADEPQRKAFYDLWLGQYLHHEPHLAHVALVDDAIAGYLVGCHVNPATSERFARLGYFQTFAAACAHYPAHLHINLTETARGTGIGARLIDAFADDTRAAGLPGLHVVTSADARNIGFYARCGFSEIAATERNGGRIVFLGLTMQ